MTPTCVQSPTPAAFPSGTCPVAVPAAPDSLDEALTPIGYSRCTFAFTPTQIRDSGFNLDDPRRMPDYDRMIAAPLRLPPFGAETASWFDAAITSNEPVSSSIAAAAARWGTGVSKCADPGWFTIDPNDANPMASAIVGLAGPYSATVDATQLASATSGVPLAMQRALAPVLRAIGYASLDVVAARGTKDRSTLEAIAAVSLTISNDSPPPFANLADLDKVDIPAMAQAATRIATVVEAVNLAQFAGMDVPALDLQTPFGAVVLRGAGADTYMPGSLAEKAALVVDTGGNDTYRIAMATGSIDLPVAISVDLGGDDLYGYVEKPIPQDMGGHRLPSDGAGRYSPTDPNDPNATLSRTPRHGVGILGVGLLYDLGAGKDTYRSLALSEGVGALGVGVLYDDGGDDSYTGEITVQGVGGWGFGLLLDRAGNDNYVGYLSVQGVGWPKGVGALVDAAGDDVYLSDPGDPSVGGDLLYTTPGIGGTDDHRNQSTAQGVGQGIRLDAYPQRIGFMGGIGVLRDVQGDDQYTAGVSAQGFGYVGGIGMLLEGAGDDTYNAIIYAQGSSAHTGVGMLHDSAGNDKYNPTFNNPARMYVSLGHGHDFSTGLFFDEAGDDAYWFGAESGGSSDIQGMAIFVDAAGADTFVSPTGTAFGAVSNGEPATSARYGDPTIGVFVKASGSGTYNILGSNVDRSGASWIHYAAAWGTGDTLDGSPMPDGNEKSSGVDRATGTVSMP